jgi:hypothetical protein
MLWIITKPEHLKVMTHHTSATKNVRINKAFSSAYQRTKIEAVDTA